MEIDTGARVIVEFATKERMTCQYVGQVLDHFVLLQVPMSPGIRERMRTGTFLQFRFLRGGKIIGFGADILRYQASPLSMVFISYPKDFSEYNLRQEGRVECRFPATLSIKGKPHPGRIVDISPNGCRFVFDETPMPKTGEKAPVSGYFTTMEGQNTYDFKGDIVLRKVRGPNKGVGIKFREAITLPDGVRDYYETLAAIKEAEAGDEFG